MRPVRVENMLDLAVREHRLVHPSGLPIASRDSPNHGGALTDPIAIIMHYTGGRSFESALAWLCRKPKGGDRGSSAHVVISRDGDVAQLVPFNLQAWHAGESRYVIPDSSHAPLEAFNRCSIGVELDNPGKLQKRSGGWFTIYGQRVEPDDVVIDERGQGWHAFADVQLQAAFEVCETLIAAYPSLELVLGHSEIAWPRGRKIDPGHAFPLEQFRGWLTGRGRA